MAGLLAPAQIVRPIRKAFSTADSNLHTTAGKSLRLAVYEPPKFRAAAAGKRFYSTTGVSSVFKAPVTAIPSTTATWALFNNCPAGGPVIAVDAVVFFLASGTQDVGSTIIVNTDSAALPYKVTYANSASMCTTNSGQRGSGTIVNAVTLTSQTWLACPTRGTGLLGNPTTIGATAWTELNGGLVIQPGYAMGIDIVSGATTVPLYGITVIYEEIDTAMS